jgi:hypothetical protein
VTTSAATPPGTNLAGGTPAPRRGGRHWLSEAVLTLAAVGGVLCMAAVVAAVAFGRLPVTHRVVSAEPAGGGHTRLVLKGDANPGPDPEPYEVSHVGLLLFAVPGGAAVVSAAGHPMVLGGLTLLVSALVTWAFWPPSPGRSESERHPAATAQVRR